MNEASAGTVDGTVDRLPLALGSLGSACAWCWLFATFNGNAFLAFFPDETNLLRAIELFGLVSGLALIEYIACKLDLPPLFEQTDELRSLRWHSEAARTPTRIILPIVPVLLGFPSLALLVLASFGISYPLGLAMLAWLCIGASVAICFFIWGAFFDGYAFQGELRASVWCILSTIVGAALFFVTSFEQPIFSAGTAFALLIGSTVLLVMLPAPYGNRPLRSSSVSTDQEARFKKALPPFRVGVNIFAFGTTFGVCLFIVFNETTVETLPLLTALFVSAGGGALLIYIRVRQTRPPLTTVQKLVLPCMIAALLPMPFVNGAGTFALGVLLMGSSIFFDLSNCIAGINPSPTATRSLLKPRSASIQRIPYQIGEWFGWCLGIGFSYVWTDSGSKSEAFIVLCLSLVFVLVLITNYLPIMSHANEFLATGEGKANSSSHEARCEEISRRYRLTPREREILVFLAKGRNAGYIQNQLSISTNTVRAHISHIYDKLQVHSQQQLMDLVDDPKSRPNGQA